MAQRLISVVINNYNYERFLGEAISSALSQDYESLEVLVVDDGSTDDSSAVIAGFHGRIRAVLKPNGGQASALNAGFAACQGDVVIFLDADDALLPSAAQQAADAVAGPVTKAYWPLLEMNVDGILSGGIIPRSTPDDGVLLNRVVMEGPIACGEVPTSGNAWSRAFLETVLPMPEADFRINADCYLSTLAPVYGPVRALAQPLSRYRVHGRNHYVTGTLAEKNERQLQMYERRCDLLSLHLQKAGAIFDTARWRNGNPLYEYLQRTSQLALQLSARIPPGSSFILIDDGELTHEVQGGRIIPDTTTIAFLEHEGAYHGRPRDDQHAASELNRLIARDNPTFVAVAWPGFWWLDYYPALRAEISRSFHCVSKTEALELFQRNA